MCVSFTGISQHMIDNVCFADMSYRKPSADLVGNGLKHFDFLLLGSPTNGI